MNLNITLLEVSDDDLAAEYNRRRLGNDSLDDVADFDIEREYENRGLGEDDVKLDAATVDQLIREFKDRDIEYEMFSSSLIELADHILNDIHQSKCVKNRVNHLIERITGRIVLKWSN